MIAFCALRKWAFLQLQAEAKKDICDKGGSRAAFYVLSFDFSS